MIEWSGIVCGREYFGWTNGEGCKKGGHIDRLTFLDI